MADLFVKLKQSKRSQGSGPNTSLSSERCSFFRNVLKILILIRSFRKVSIIVSIGYSVQVLLPKTSYPKLVT